MLQVLLQGCSRKVLWPYYYVQQMRLDVHAHLTFGTRWQAQSVWFEN